VQSFYGDPTGNTSGQGKHAIVPPEILKWNWGAFFLTWIWGIFNQVWISLLFFVPIVGFFIMPFVLGAKGNEWAWRNKKWHSVEHFLEVQRKWARWGFLFFCIATILLIILFILLIIIIVVFGTYILPFIVNTFENFGFDSSFLQTILQLFTGLTNGDLNNLPNTNLPNDLTPPTDINPSTDTYQYDVY